MCVCVCVCVCVLDLHSPKNYKETTTQKNKGDRDVMDV